MLATKTDKQDVVKIKDLEFSCIIGILPEERVKAQRVIFNVNMYTDLSNAMSCDDVSLTLNYADAVDIIKNTAEALKAGTLEYLAGQVIEALKKHFGEKLQGLEIEIIKPDILPNVSGVGISVSRKFGD